MQALVYALCAFASLACTVLLLRGYMRTRTRLLFWGGICFGFLTVTNVLLFVDLIVFPEGNLLFWRNSTTLLGLLFFVYGLIFESESQTPR